MGAPGKLPASLQQALKGYDPKTHNLIQDGQLWREYPSYRSPHAIKTTPIKTFQGITPAMAISFGTKAGLLAGAGVFALLFYASGIPRVQDDVFQRIPILGSYVKRQEVHPKDNPF